MRTKLLALVAIAVVAIALRTAPPIVGQAPAFEVPRMADGTPDLSGIWQALNTANYNILAHPASAGPLPHLLGAVGAVPAGQGVVEGNELPYQPGALERAQRNFETQLTVDPFDLTVGDPEAKCFMPGVPRANYMPYPFQIIQGTDKILIAYEFDHASRVVHMTTWVRAQWITGWGIRGGSGTATRWSLTSRATLKARGLTARAIFTAGRCT